MDPLVIAALGALALLVMLLLGVPVGYALAFVGIVGIYLVGGSGVAATAMRRVPFSSVVTFSLVVIPLFVLMGEMATLGGVAEDTFTALRTLGGRLRASLAGATVAAAGAFGAVSGSSIATAITIGRPALTEMKRHGYHHRLSLGVVAAGGTLGTLMPPSLILILYALIADISITNMFLAGILPAFLTVGMYLLLIAGIALAKPQWLPGGEPATIRTRIAALPKLLPVTILGTVVLGSLYFGLVSLSEIAALGAFLAMLIWAVQRGLRRKDWRGAGNTVMAAVKITSMIGMILIGSVLFSTFLSYSRVPIVISEWLVGLDLSRTGFIVMSVVLFVVLGMFLETIGMMLLTIPFLLAGMTHLGIDPLWYGIFFVKVAEVGLITPPVGLNIYVIRGIDPSASLTDVFAGAGIFILADLVVIALISVFPGIVTWLPSVAGI